MTVICLCNLFKCIWGFEMFNEKSKGLRNVGSNVDNVPKTKTLLKKNFLANYFAKQVIALMSIEYDFNNMISLSRALREFFSRQF